MALEELPLQQLEPCGLREPVDPSGYKQDRDARVATVDAEGEFWSGEVRETDVEDEQIRDGASGEAFQSEILKPRDISMLTVSLRAILCRVAIALLPATLSTSALAQEVTATPADPVLILIHGRDQPVGKRAEVEFLWQNALDSGLARAGVPGLIPHGARRFYWYADMLDSHVRCRMAAGEEVTGVDEVRDLFLAIARQMPNAAERALVQWRMRDTEKYLRDFTLACVVDSRLLVMLDSIPRRVPLVIVAHSMGSMIIYKNLLEFMEPLRHQSNPRVYLVTIGSMLGEPAVQRTLLGSHAGYPGPVPLPVVWWRNVLNKGDLLAFKARNAFKSEYLNKVPKDIAIDTRGRNRHSAVGYLGSPDFGQVLREAWCTAAPTNPSCAAHRTKHK